MDLQKKAVSVFGVDRVDGLLFVCRAVVFAAELQRSQTAVAFEYLYKIRGVKEPGFHGDLINGFLSCFKFVTGTFDPPVADVFSDADADLFAEEFAEIIRFVTGDLRKMLQGEFGIQMVGDVAQHPSQLPLGVRS